MKKRAPKKKKRVSPAVKEAKQKKRIPVKSLKANSVGKANLDLSGDYQLPSDYAKTCLVLMVKDPFWIYAYWKISKDSLELFKYLFGKKEGCKLKIILRMYDVTLINFNGTNANSYFDIEVGESAKNWYIDLWKDNKSYVAEIGLLEQNGNFCPIARSNFVHTPRAEHSQRSEQIWMEVKGADKKNPFVVAGISKPFKKNTENQLKKKRIIYLTEEDIRKYYSGLNPYLKDILFKHIGKIYGFRPGRYQIILEGLTEEERLKILSNLEHGYFIKRQIIGSSEKLIFIEKNKDGGASDFVYEQRPGCMGDKNE